MSWIPRLPAETWISLWLTWLGVVLASFLLFQSWALLTKGVPLTGTIGWMREHHTLVFALLAAAIIAAGTWAIPWHWWLERDFFPRLRRTWVDDGIIAVAVFVATFLVARGRRKGRQDSPGESP